LVQVLVDLLLFVETLRQYEEANMNTNEISQEADPDYPTLDSISIHVPIPNPAASAMIIVNYMDLLMKIQNDIVLRQSLDIKQYFSDCFEELSEKEKDRLRQSGIVGEYRNVPVFAANKQPELVVTAMLEEAEYFAKKQQLSQESSLKSKLMSSVSEDSLSTVQPLDDENSLKSSVQTESTRKRLLQKNLSIKQKSIEQRQKDNRIRAETSKQRKYLYDLIQSDDISKIFAAKAGKDAQSLVGATTEEQELLQSATSAFGSMAGATSKG
jgi:hypothetical protein